jgi:hypothetical protein
MSQIVSNYRPAVNARHGRGAHLGVTPPDSNWRTAAPNHSPKFYADERAFPVGMRIPAHLAAGFLEMGRGGAGTASAP